MKKRVLLSMVLSLLASSVSWGTFQAARLETALLSAQREIRVKLPHLPVYRKQHGSCLRITI